MADTWNLVLPNGTRLVAKEIINRWYTANYIFVKVLYHDGRVGILRCNGFDIWTVSLLPLDSSWTRTELLTRGPHAFAERKQRNSLHKQSSEPYLRLIAAPDSRERNEGNAR